MQVWACGHLLSTAGRGMPQLLHQLLPSDSLAAVSVIPVSSLATARSS